jgi:hypothetical protein
MSNREIIENALKRVNALAGTDGKLYRDNAGWYVIWRGNHEFGEQSMTSGELISYLFGIEDALNFINKKEKLL